MPRRPRQAGRGAARPCTKARRRTAGREDNERRPAASQALNAMLQIERRAGDGRSCVRCSRRRDAARRRFRARPSSSSRRSERRKRGHHARTSCATTERGSAQEGVLARPGELDRAAQALETAAHVQRHHRAARGRRSAAHDAAAHRRSGRSRGANGCTVTIQAPGGGGGGLARRSRLSDRTDRRPRMRAPARTVPRPRAPGAVGTRPSRRSSLFAVAERGKGRERSWLWRSPLDTQYNSWSRAKQAIVKRGQIPWRRAS